MKNMAAAERILPMKAVCQLKNLKPGRKLGADPILRRKQARFMTKKVICLAVRPPCSIEGLCGSYLVTH
jgi:hypothetical protein